MGNSYCQGTEVRIMWLSVYVCSKKKTDSET
jgi:hypothetical protein